MSEQEVQPGDLGYKLGPALPLPAPPLTDAQRRKVLGEFGRGVDLPMPEVPVTGADHRTDEQARRDEAAALRDQIALLAAERDGLRAACETIRRERDEYREAARVEAHSADDARKNNRLITDPYGRPQIPAEAARSWESRARLMEKQRDQADAKIQDLAKAVEEHGAAVAAYQKALDEAKADGKQALDALLDVDLRPSPRERLLEARQIWVADKWARAEKHLEKALKENKLVREQLDLLSFFSANVRGAVRKLNDGQGWDWTEGRSR